MPEVTAKVAAEQAALYIKELIETVVSIEIEEVELSRDSRLWHVTLSYLTNPFGGARKYKVFTISAKTGQVKSMKIREMQ